MLPGGLGLTWVPLGDSEAHVIESSSLIEIAELLKTDPPIVVLVKCLEDCSDHVLCYVG